MKTEIEQMIENLFYKYSKDRAGFKKTIKEYHNFIVPIILAHAAENATVKEEFEYQDEFSDQPVYSHSVDKNSILNLEKDLKI